MLLVCNSEHATSIEIAAVAPRGHWSARIGGKPPKGHEARLAILLTRSRGPLLGGLFSHLLRFALCVPFEPLPHEARLREGDSRDALHFAVTA